MRGADELLRVVQRILSRSVIGCPSHTGLEGVKRGRLHMEEEPWEQ